jgi:hypothetical protein
MAPTHIVDRDQPAPPGTAQLKAKLVEGASQGPQSMETHPNGVLKSKLLRSDNRKPVADDYEYELAANAPLPTLDVLGVDFDEDDDPAAISEEFFARFEAATKDPEAFTALFIPDGELSAMS